MTGHLPVDPAVLLAYTFAALASDLTLTVAAINAWNRLSIAGRLIPGAYQPAHATA